MARAGKYAQPTTTAWDAKRAKAKAKAKQALLRDAEETATDVADDTAPEGYAEFTKDELVEELKARELPHTGNKEELITRLEEDDEAHSEEE